MKHSYWLSKNWLPIVAAVAVLLGLGLFFYKASWPGSGVAVAESPSALADSGGTEPSVVPATDDVIIPFPDTIHYPDQNAATLPPSAQNNLPFDPQSGASTEADANVIVDNYLAAWRSQRRDELSPLWLQLSQCEACLKQLAELLISSNLAKGLTLELAIKMVALDSRVVLPVFSALIDPAENRSTAIILSEKLIIDGRAEYVARVFNAIQVAEQKGYEEFAQQLTWVVSKLNNPEGVGPVLDIITGRAAASPAYTRHVSRIFSKTVLNIPDKAFMSDIVSNYYLAANAAEKEQLWEVVSHHPGTLVQLAAQANAEGQSYNVEKYATAITQLPDVRAVDGVMKLQGRINQPPGYFVALMQAVVKRNDNARALHRLDDYLRHLNVGTESRILAAEGLLAAKHNPLSRQILEKVLNQANYGDSEVLSYISGRL